MRFDSKGLFWKDEPASRGRSNIARTMPPIPETGWSAPTEFPRLSDAPALSLDVETYDPELLDNGPGWARDCGHIVGVSVGASDGGRWYFPVRHEVEPETNMDPDKVFGWLRDVMCSRQPKVGANLLYDIGWLAEEGVDVRGPLYDVQFAEALLSEEGKVNLDWLAEKYIGEHKDTNLLYQWCSDFYGENVGPGQRKNIYRTPPRLAGPYAESDVDLPLRVLPHQFRELKKQGLAEVFDMENRLIPLLIAMRQRGVRVDLERAEFVHEKLGIEICNQQDMLNEIAGLNVNINCKADLVRAFDKNGLSYNMTKPSKSFPKGQPSFTKKFLKSNKHPICGKINEIRKLEKIQNTFLKSYIMDSNVGGRIFCQFHPLRTDDNGARSGRYSSSHPNLQNIPSRDLVFGPLVRGLFVPDEGHRVWRKFDLSQIEYRFLAHFAVGEGAEQLRAAYREDASTDYHKLTQALVLAQTGVELGRKPTKNINFGFIYGMGVKTLSESLGVSTAQGRKLFEAYHRGAPFAKATMEALSQEAINIGYVTTIMNRRSRFNLFEPCDWGDDGRLPALPYEKALRTYGPNIQRAYAHKALNRRLQGSAADYMKMVMLNCWDAGVFDETGVPCLTVHDELDFSDPGGKEEAFAEVKHLFETALELEVPITAEEEAGPDWGHVEKVA
jgi:DNA polymerase I-like protein with 3'-5' exonuclease and polymerase domains